MTHSREARAILRDDFSPWIWEKLIARLERNPDLIPETGCRLHPSKGGAKGYIPMSISEGGVTMYRSAHRLAYVAYKGDIPQGMLVRHLCHHPACVNPDHLELGTNQDNKDDAVKAGRHARGETNARAKLTWDQVTEARRRHAKGGVSQAQLARDYGVSHGTMNQIILGRLWKDPR